MNYELSNDPYIDSPTGVFKNLLGIKSPEELTRVEGDISGLKMLDLAEHPIEGNFDLSHLQAIHRYVFGSIYPWAGELRTVELIKDSTKFASVEYLPKAAEEIFDGLRDEKFLTELHYDEFVSRLAHYYSEVNILHPFREGNGRVQRVFFSSLAAQSGRQIAWDKMDPNENISASIAAYKDDESQLIQMFNPLISLIEK